MPYLWYSVYDCPVCVGALFFGRSTVPDGVNVVDKNGGGWMMQRSYIHAVAVPTRSGDHAGYLFMTDDVLLNIGQLSRAVNESGCDVIWRAPMRVCHDFIEESDKHVKKGEVIDTLREESRRFFNQSDEQFRAQLRSNLGSPSKYCIGHQNDFVYMPTAMAADWARVAQQMTDAGLFFTFTLHAALYGIARMEDMVVLRSKYLGRHARAGSYLRGCYFSWCSGKWGITLVQVDSSETPEVHTILSRQTANISTRLV